MTDRDLEQVLSWRNHPDVRRFMYTSHMISPDEHARWFERTREQQGVWLLIYELEGIPRGFVNISRTRSSQVADWGFYLAPDSESGTGSALGMAALEYAFRDLELHKVCGQALGFNKRSIKFHEKLGFIREGVLREQHFDGEHYHDVLCFGLLASEWKLGKQ
ncbi:MAG: UDP-4-amino-4,6-dideoxy-N-acetyl-beta-L-altrosamine N-acetyltransferase [Rhodopirellula sp.]|nr:UDP-4-amino-4,6-dideoxy-N-acetyl-beta-L-altrosamine N-acetyltransferase [Rhodopirellula sp.]